MAKSDEILELLSEDLFRTDAEVRDRIRIGDYKQVLIDLKHTSSLVARVTEKMSRDADAALEKMGMKIDSGEADDYISNAEAVFFDFVRAEQRRDWPRLIEPFTDALAELREIK